MKPKQGGQPSSQEPSFSKYKTATAAVDGKQLCKAYNDNRGCKLGARCTMSHTCDLLIKGLPCGQNHGRMNHDMVRHSTPDPK